VYYLVADEVDRDPFTLFLLRGRPRADVLAELRARRSPARGEKPKLPKRVDEGLTPRAAYARRPGAIPALPPPPRVPGPPAVLDLDPPPSTGWTAAALSALAADAASLARDLLVGGATAAELTFEEDLARRAAGRTGAEVTKLAAAAGVSPRDLSRWAAAWREAGRGGLAALRESWQPGPGPLSEAESVLADAGLPGTPRTWRNRLTRGELQLRYGRDARWYRFVRAGAEWRLDGPPSASPLDLAY
jgi:hypothetical protein